MNTTNRVDIKEVAAAALNLINTLVPEWLPSGKREASEWVSVNPLRADNKAGSFKVNMATGLWSDFACGDSGGDLVSLYRYLKGFADQVEAAKALAERVGVAALSAVSLPAPAKIDDWVCVMPVPLDASSRHLAHIKRGHPVMVSEFNDESGGLLGYVMRFKTSDGGKEDLPHTFWRNTKTGVSEWKWRQWPEPRPLYGLDDLAARPDLPVLVVEGEKCKNVAAASWVGEKHVVVTWSGGSNAVDKTDWSILRGRKVCLWPDCDSQREPLSKAERDAGLSPDDKPFLLATMQPGAKAMAKIATKLIEQGCRVYTVNIELPGIWPNGFDIADALDDPAFDIKARLANAWYVDPEALPLHPISSGDSGVVAVSNDASKNGNSSTEGAGDGGNSSQFAAYAAELIADYGLVEGKTKVIHRKSGIEFSRLALNAKFSKEAVESWFNNPRKVVVTPVEVNRLKKEAERKLAQEREEIKECLKRYTYLDGSSNIWDAQLYRIIDQGSAKLAMGGEFKDWLESPVRKVLPMDHVVFEPGIEMGERYINLFRGLPFEYTHSVPKSELVADWMGLMTEFDGCINIMALIDHLCNGDKKALEWLLNWFAYPLQNVGAKMATAVLMHSDVHGSGKSLLFEEIIKPLYGEYGATVGQSAMESQYTGSRSGKLFMLFEEIFSNKQKYDHSGSLKQMITGKTQQSERKFVDSYEEANHMNCVFLSNNIQPFLVEEYDRRFLVLWPESTTPVDLMQGVLYEIAKGGLQAFFNDLLALPLTISSDGIGERFDNHTKPPMTDAKARVISWGLSGWQLFHKQWLDGELDVPYVSCKVDDVWRLFQFWCTRNNEKAIGRNKFVIAIGTKMPKARRRWRNLNSNRRDEVLQDQIYKVGIEADGVTEQDFLGGTVIRFRDAVSAHIGVPELVD